MRTSRLLGAGCFLLLVGVACATAPRERSVPSCVGACEMPAFTEFDVAPELLNRAEVLTAIQKFYPVDERNAGVTGLIVLGIRIDESGLPDSILVAEGSGSPGLDAAAVRVATTFEFSPAQLNGERIPAWFQIPLSFDVR